MARLPETGSELRRGAPLLEAKRSALEPRKEGKRMMKANELEANRWVRCGRARCFFWPS